MGCTPHNLGVARAARTPGREALRARRAKRAVRQARYAGSACPSEGSLIWSGSSSCSAVTRTTR